MSHKLRYITHPNVNVDPTIAVTQWSLSGVGRRRAEAMLRQPWVPSVTRIVSSSETKAVETAELLANHLGLVVEVRESCGENDRTATGFVPPEEFEVLADAFFADPTSSTRGWERAVDAQQRIVTGLADLLECPSEGDIAVVGHGAVGTLWYCHLTQLQISRIHDQPGQGHFFTVDRDSATVEHAWTAIDDTAAG